MDTPNAEWTPPRCEHGRILLGCPRYDCAEQNAYVAEQNARINAWHERQQAEARRLVRSMLGLDGPAGGPQ